MKKGVVNFVVECSTCLQVKIKYQKPPGKLQPLPIPGWKWEHIMMEFLMGLPKTEERHDAICIVGDYLTKSAYFIPL